MSNYVQEVLDQLREERGTNETITISTDFEGVKIALVPLTLLNIDEEYQRTENLSLIRANNIKDHFDNALCGVVTVFYRNGKYYVSDGMHRVLAKALLGHHYILANIITGTYEEEVNHFINQAGNSRRPSAYDRLKAKASIAESPAKEIFEVCRKYNISIIPRTKGSINGSISCVSLIERLAEKNGIDHLDHVLHFLCKTGWSNEKTGLINFWVSATSVMLRRIGSLDCSGATKLMIEDRMEEKYKTTRPVTFLSEAMVHFEGRLPECSAVAKYNRFLIEQFRQECE